jgi:23S rRNA (pseudouridine1915-N3)-methyltransferase
VKLRILAVGGRPSRWVDDAFSEYVKRLPRDNSLELVLIPAAPGSTERRKALRIEGQRLLKSIGQNELVVALDGTGIPYTSVILAKKMERWRMDGRDVAFIIGGANGLSTSVLESAEDKWSLSALTFPHQLVRILVAEQIYRAWSLNSGHPYHRA